MKLQEKSLVTTSNGNISGQSGGQSDDKTKDQHNGNHVNNNSIHGYHDNNAVHGNQESSNDNGNLENIKLPSNLIGNLKSHVVPVIEESKVHLDRRYKMKLNNSCHGNDSNGSKWKRTRGVRVMYSLWRTLVGKTVRMLEAETEAIQKNSVFGDLDCNDNTPVLQPHVDKQNSANEMSPTKSPIISSPIRSSSRSSNMSDPPTAATGQAAIPGLLYSPEDTLNNDFFYDDEFSVPFDANLTDAEIQMLDSVDLNAILHLSKNCDDDNIKWHGPKMTCSKSDGALYQPEGEISDSDKEMDTSGERDIVSSSELSDFKSEPLFSPPPGSVELDGGLSDSAGQGDLSGSFSLRDAPRYNYDWSANKNQYMLSFDRSPSKQSDELSQGRTPTPSDGRSSMTSWAQKSVSTSQTSWGSHQGAGSGNKSVDVYNSGLCNSRKSSSSGGTTTTMMTTWQQVVDKSSPDFSKSSPGSGMTTWKRLQEARTPPSTPVEIHGPRSTSLPNLQPTSPEVVDSRSVVTDCGAEQITQHATRTLLDLFHRSRSREEDPYTPPSVSTEAGREAMISPGSLHQLTGTWSVSPPPSDGSFATAPQTNSDRSYTTPPLGADVCTTDSLNGLETPAKLVSWKTVPAKTLVECATSPIYVSFNEAGTQMSIYKQLQQDPSIQCPPLVKEKGIQTSILENSSRPTTTQSLQTSFSMGEISPIPAVRVVKRSHSQPRPQGCMEPGRDSPELVVQLSARAKERMSRSAFFVSKALPDLSFLNRAMSQSVVSTPSPKESLHIPTGSPRNSTHFPDLIPDKAKPKAAKAADGKVKKTKIPPFTKEQLKLLKHHQQVLHQMQRVKIIEDHGKLGVSMSSSEEVKGHCEVKGQEGATTTGVGDLRNVRAGSLPPELATSAEKPVSVPATTLASGQAQGLSQGQGPVQSQSGSKSSQIPRKPSRLPGKMSGIPSRSTATTRKPQVPAKPQVASKPSAPPVPPKPALSKPSSPAKPLVAAKPRLLAKGSQIPMLRGCQSAQDKPKLPDKPRSRIRRAESSESRESSPGLSSSRRSRSTDSASTNNSFCSSSSSGIDPGSYEGQGHRVLKPAEREPPRDLPPAPTSNPKLYSYAPEETVSDSSSDGGHRVAAQEREYWGDNEDCETRGGISRKDSGLGISHHKGATLCQKCREQLDDENTKPMTKSHPTYARLMEPYDKEPCRTVEYLLVSPTRRPQSRDPSSTVTGTEPRRPPPKPPRSRPVVPGEQAKPVDSDNSDPQKKPLKSCLVKRRRGDRKPNALKHRSWSDPYDGMVLKYSQNGEIKYQLVTHEGQCTWRHSTGELQMAVVCQEAEERSQDKQDPPPVPTQSQCGCQQSHCCHDDPEEDDGDKTPIVEMPAAVPTSPEQIPLPACACHTTHAVLHSSSSDSGENRDPPEALADDGEPRGPKKSVSFSEEVRFHSPHASPHQSPRKRNQFLGYCDQHSVVARHPLSRELLKPRPRSLPMDLGLFAIDSVPETAPRDFLVSPTRTDAPSFPHSDSMVDLAHKKDLMLDVMRAAEVVLQYFGKTRDPEEKEYLGSTAHHLEIGELLLTHLCPAVHAILLDGLNPHVRSLFGKVRNSTWKVVEDSADMGPSSPILAELIKDLKALSFLDTTWLKVNAFIFGLLNHKALDFWLSHIQSHQGLISRHYSSTGFVALSTTATKSLFLDMTTSLQPLAQIQFRLEYNFEFRMLKERHQKQMADYMLEKHVSRSADALIEGHQFLHQRAVLGMTSDFKSLTPDLRVMEVSKQALLLSKQTKDYLQDRGKKFFDKLSQKELLANVNDYLPMGSKGPQQVPKLKGINDSNISSTSTASSDGSDGPPKTFQNSASDESQSGESAQSVVDQLKPSEQIIKDNEMMGDLASSDLVKPEGILAKVSRRLKGMTSSGQSSVDKDAYKKGVTEYRFDLENQAQQTKTSMETKVSGTAQSEAGSLGNQAAKPQGLFDAKGMPSRDVTNAPLFQIPKRSQPASDLSKRLSDSSLPIPTATASTTTTTTSSSSNAPTPPRRWSSLGPKLINVFDKLLLDPSKSRSTKGSKSGTSSGVVRSVSMYCNKVAPPVPTLSSTGSMNTAGKRAELMRVRSLDERALGQRRPLPSPPLTPIGSVQTLCHYVGTEDNQLSFEKGSVLDLMKEVDQDWLVCRHGNQKGLVHRACVKNVAKAQEKNEKT